MKILVIGGSYFLGRWFVQSAYKGHDITVVNRGNIPIGLEGVTEITADRHNDDELCKLRETDGFDAVVDLCAYDAGDIGRILKHIGGSMPSRYIYISTVDVYRKGKGHILDESSELADLNEINDRHVSMDGADHPDAGDIYIRGKTELEYELDSKCSEYGIRGVSVRPAILYGPGNYAPRESIYLEWIKRAGQIIHPTDADGFFQMLYVADAARGILRLCEIPEEELKRAYNFCTDEIITYDSFESALERAYCLYDPALYKERAFTRIDVSVETAVSRNIPLPFPLRASESEIYSSNSFLDLGTKITPLEEGLLACIRIG